MSPRRRSTFAGSSPVLRRTDLSPSRRGGRPRGGGWLLRLLAIAGLAVEAYVHLDLAGRYDTVGDTVTQGQLFRAVGIAAAVAALALLVTRRRPVWAFAALVAALSLGPVLLYRYVDVGSLGPLPSMYEPVWYAEKTASAVAEGVALLAALVGLARAR